MDLRMVKTKQQIKKAFLILRERLMPEKIKVKDICEVAMINKTTFYNHYTDSAELANEIDELAIDKVIEAFKEKDKLFEDPKAYILGLYTALEHEQSNLMLIFRGKQDTLCAKLEEKLKICCNIATYDIDDRVRLSFAIGGFVRVLKDYLFDDVKCNIDQLAESSAHILDDILRIKKASTVKA